MFFRKPEFQSQKGPWGAWVAQVVKIPSLDFSSGHDSSIVSSSLTWGAIGILKIPSHGFPINTHTYIHMYIQT